MGPWHLRIHPAMLNPQVLSSDTEGQLYYAILYKGLAWIFEYEQILVWWGALESIPSLDTEG